MKMRFILIGFFQLIFFFQVNALASSCQYFTPIEINCDFYKCLEEKYSCGSEGYPLGYGFKYCKRFSSFNTPSNDNVFGLDLSSKGVQWRDHTLRCLQGELVSTIYEVTQNSCSTVKSIGFGTHAKCYTSGPVSICSLPVKDWAAIMTMVKAQDYFSVESVDQVTDVLVQCGYQLMSEYDGLDVKRSGDYQYLKAGRTYSSNQSKKLNDQLNMKRKKEIESKLQFLYQLEENRRHP